MVYVVARTRDHRVAMMTEGGTAQYEEPQVDTSYLQALGEQDARNAANQQAEDQRDPKPAIDVFTQALGDCDVMVDLIQNLEQMRYLDIKMMNNKPRSAHAAMQQMTTSCMSRAARQRAALRDCAARLHAGAQALRLFAAQDNLFHGQVSQLQHYWSIRRTPPSMNLGPDAPYLVDLTLGYQTPSSRGGPSATAAATAGGAAAAGRTPGAAADQGALTQMMDTLSAVPLLRGPQGQLRMQLPRKHQLQRVDATTTSDSTARQDTSLTAAAPTEPALAASETDKGVRRSARSSSAGGQGIKVKIKGAGTSASTQTGQPARNLAVLATGPQGDQQEVFAGLHSVHAALLSRQQQLLWAQLLDMLQRECTASVSGGGQNFMARLVQLLADLLSRTHAPHASAHRQLSSLPSTPAPWSIAAQPATGQELMIIDTPQQQQLHQHTRPAASHALLSDPLLASLRPVLLEHCSLVRGVSPLLSTQKGGPPPAALQHRLLHDCVAILSHTCTRASVWRALLQHVVRFPQVTLRWVPSSRMCTSAIRVECGALDSCLVLVQDQSVEVDGVLCGHSGGTRWAGDGHTTVTRHELPHLLPVVILGLSPTQA